MCSTSAAVENLECYLEDLVTCFEDFVKKSLLVVTVGIGTLIGMLLYMLRSRSSNRALQDTRNSYTQFSQHAGKNGRALDLKEVASMGIQSTEYSSPDAEYGDKGGYSKGQASMGIQACSNLVKKTSSFGSNTCLPTRPCPSCQPTLYSQPCPVKPCPQPPKQCNQSSLPKPCNQPCPPRPCPPPACIRPPTRSCVKPTPVPCSESNESMFLREIALGSCPKNTCNPKPCLPRLCRPGALNCSNHRITVPSCSPPCTMKRPQIPRPTSSRHSCCSLCCDDDK